VLVRAASRPQSRNPLDIGALHRGPQAVEIVYSWVVIPSTSGHFIGAIVHRVQ